MTAVTTAGLLAGLFGSAFVPAARAAAETLSTDSGLTCYSSDIDVESVGSEDGTCYAAAGSTTSITVSLEDAAAALTIAAGDTISSLSIVASGGTFSASQVSGTAAVPGGYSLNATSKTMTINRFEAIAANTVITFRVNIVAPASGANMTLELFQGTTSLGDLVIVGAVAGTAGTVNATYSELLPLATDADGDLAANAVSADQEAIDNTAPEACGGSLLSVSGVPCVPAGTTTQLYVLHLADGFDAAVTDLAVSATVTGPCGVAVQDEDTGALTFSDEETSARDSAADNDGDAWVGIKNNGDAGTCVLTITAGSLTYTRTVIFLGNVESITISGPTHMATDAGQVAGFNDGLTVVCKDEAGTVHGDGGGAATSYTDGDMNDCDDDALTFTVTNSIGVNLGFSDAADEAAGAAAALSSTIAAKTFSDLHLYQNVVTAGFSDEDDTFSVADDGNWDIPNDLCAEDEEGLTRNIKVTDGALVESNTITVTCVADAIKITGMTALATGTSGSATSGKNGQTIKVRVTAEDGYGRPAGAGATFSFTATKSVSNISAGTAASFSNGAATLTITLGTTSGAQYVIYSATDSDQVTTGAQAFAQKLSFTVTNDADVLSDYLLTKRGAKVTGSNFAARATVKVEVENASKGTVKVYTRRANAAGKVVYTVAGRGTFYVTMYTGAAGSEVLSNTVTVKR